MLALYFSKLTVTVGIGINFVGYLSLGLSVLCCRVASGTEREADIVLFLLAASVPF